MKPIVPILGVISALWLFLGTWWMSKMVCGTDSTAIFSVTDDGFKASSNDMFTFLMSSDEVTVTPETQSAFKSIAKHLTDNPEKHLILTGMFNDKESNETAYDNLGIARAETIKSFLIQMGADTDRIRTYANEVDNIYFNKEKKMDGGVNFLFENREADDPPSENDSSLDTGGEPTSSTSNNKDASTPMLLSVTDSKFRIDSYDGLSDYLRDLKSIVKNNPDKQVMVTCYNNETALAVDIAKKVRRELRNYGFASDEVDRETAKMADSPNGKPVVKIAIH